MSETLLFSARSIWTMVHGVALGGSSLILLAAAIFGLWTIRPSSDGAPIAPEAARALVRVMVLGSVVLWLAVIIGTYVAFPPYRATPPKGLIDLAFYPRSLLRSDPGTAWLHDFAMEVKEHVPWIAAMLATAAAFVGVRYGSRIGSDAVLRRTSMALLGVSFAIVSVAALLGILINKVAPLE